jgi:two-component system sensor histidine kinase TorS
VAQPDIGFSGAKIVKYENVTAQPEPVKVSSENHSENPRNSTPVKTLKTRQNRSKKQGKISGGLFIELSERLQSYLNAITGLSEVLADEQLADEQRQYVDDINEAGRNAESMLNDAAELCRIETGEFDEVAQECDLEELLSEICAMVQPEAAKKMLEFAFIYCNSIPAKIRCDRQLLRKCLTNLAFSAIDSTDTGYVHIKVGVENNNNGPNIRFDFIDCCGIICLNKAKKGVILEPFSRHNDPGKNMFDCRGLRLTITKRLAKILKGKLSVSSNPGRGLILSLVIPAGVDIGSVKLLSVKES